MRTLRTQVRLRRLTRTFAEALERLLSEPAELQMATAVASRLQTLGAEVREAWRFESLAGRPDESLDRYVNDSLRIGELAIAGLTQDGADLQLLGRDFEDALLPLEVFLRGLDLQPALQRSA